MTKSIVYVPIYEKNGCTFFIQHDDFAANTEQEAREIGLGSMLVECIIIGMTFTSEVKKIDIHNTPHIPATLTFDQGNHWHVGILSGPEFDKRVQEHKEATMT